MKQLGFICLMLLASAAWAGSTANQTVNIEIPVVDEITVSASPLTITFVAPAGGDPFADVTDATTSLSWTTNQASRKITGEYDTVETGLTLKVEITSVTGGTSAGQVTLGTVAGDLVTGISDTSGSGTLTYTASATMGADSAAFVVTYSIVDGA